MEKISVDAHSIYVSYLYYEWRIFILYSFPKFLHQSVFVQKFIIFDLELGSVLRIL